MQNSLTLVLGGADSGKSEWAENRVCESSYRKIYLATAQVWDDETKDRVTRHKTRRDGEWNTLECPFELIPALDALRPNEIALLDCITMWLSNHLLAEHDLDAEIEALLQALRRCQAPVVMVSNEVGFSIVPENELARRFRSLQGQLNQRLAAESDLVVAVMAGLPLVLKGQL